MDPLNTAQVGDLLYGYTVMRTFDLPNIAATFYELEHVSGAKHIHIARNDNNHTFCAIFPTVPQDSTGVAHILEHMVLAGSERYPLKDPFFAMIPRSLATFTNAFTGSDWTAYPFSTRNPKDYSNMLSVYLDAVFFPLLREFTFKREGHRLEFSDPQSSASELGFQGIVFNEMKGAMASGDEILRDMLGRALYPDLTYACNSGGDPRDIVKLTQEDLVSFHRRHYHPSNAYIFTYGSLPLEHHLEQIDRLALHRFSKDASAQVHVDLQTPFTQPRQVEDRYPSTETARQAQVALSWMVSPTVDIARVIEMRLISDILLSHPAAPLHKALLESELGDALIRSAGYDDEYVQGAFWVGLKATDIENADAIEALILDTLKTTVDRGISSEQIESALHQMEISSREISDSDHPYSLNVMFSIMQTWIRGGDPLQMLCIDDILTGLREKIRENPRYLEGVIQTHLLDNPHRVRLILKPDPLLAAQLIEEEQHVLQSIAQNLTEQDRQKIVSDSLELIRLQDEQDNSDGILPTLEVADIQTVVPRVDYQFRSLPGVRVARCALPTNGLCYLNVRVQFSHLSDHHKQLLPLYAFVLTRSGAGDLDDMAMTHRIEALTGGIRAHVTINPVPDDIDRSFEYLAIRGKALERNAAHLIDLTHRFLAEPVFNPARLGQWIKQQRSSIQAGVVYQGDAYARSLARAQLSHSAAHQERINGLSFLKVLHTWADATPDQLDALLTDFREISHSLRRAPADICWTASETEMDPQGLDKLAASFDASEFSPNVAHASFARKSQARVTDVPVSYNAKSFRAVPYTHPDAPSLRVLASLLSSKYTLREIREKGGAYGGSARYDAQMGLFSLSSYRDPHIERTFDVFSAVLDYISAGVSEAELKEALLAAGGDLDPLISPDILGYYRVFNDFDGYTPEVQETFRRRLVQVTSDDLVRVARTYLRDEMSAIALISNADKVASVQNLLNLNVERV
ncbi:MAG: insulinase family protein [Deinococcaceae bacterium]